MDTRPLERVVVTGMGVASPLGITVDDFWQALLAGDSGVVTIPVFDKSARMAMATV